MKTLILSALLFAGAVHADTLPDKPQPVGREFWADTAALGVAWTLDSVSTAQGFAQGGHEIGPIFTGSRSAGKVMVAWAGVDLAAVVASYEWKKHVHNRVLHPFWRAFLLIPAEEHTHAAIGNWSH